MDMDPQTLIIECLKIIKIIEQILHFITRTVKTEVWDYQLEDKPWQT